MNMNEETKSLSALTPSIAKRKLEHRIEVQDRQYNDQYSSCCSDRKTDARLIQYIMKISISFTILIFSFYQLSKAHPCDGLFPF
jgi:hypothetical protein